MSGQRDSKFVVCEPRLKQEALRKCFIRARRAMAGRRKSRQGAKGSEREGANLEQLVKWGHQRADDIEHKEPSFDPHDHPVASASLPEILQCQNLRE